MSPYRKPAGSKTDCERILELLRAHEGTWVPLNAILRLGIAQYNARILQLRRLGFDIENRTEFVTHGHRKHSWFRLNPKTAS